MHYLFLTLLTFFACCTRCTGAAEEKSPSLSIPLEDTQLAPLSNETDDIYWDTPPYLSKLEESAGKIQYVYHIHRGMFIGEQIVPLNQMPYRDGFEEVYKKAISKYVGREHLLTLVIPTLNCLWNDVVFLSPVHPHKQYEELIKIGYNPVKLQFYKIPIDVLKEKRVNSFQMA